MEVAVLFGGWFQRIFLNERYARLIIVCIDHFTRERHFLAHPSIYMKNYGEKDVKKYADRFSSHGRNKGCGR